MIDVVIPNNFIEERKYIIETLLTTFLGLNVNIVSDSTTSDYLITLPNAKQITIKDDFFSKFITDEGYLHTRNIPKEVQFGKNRFLSEENIPILYGSENITIEPSAIACNIDIFASSFFMLSRWEEYVTSEKDEHARFPDTLSLAYKFNFHKRPIVNEYTEMLWNMMSFLDNSLKRKEQKYTVSITHDVDNFRRYDTLKKYIKALAGDIINRKNPLLCFSTTNDYIQYKLGLKKDPHDTFDFLMDISEKHNLKSHFYFMPNILGETDAKYDIRDSLVKKTIDTIVKRGHIIGIHGSYDGFNQTEIFENDIKRIRNISPNINKGRQHYLRFENPTTWQLWEDYKLKYDSTIGFSHFAGFRSGTCYSYPVFNVLSRKKLKLQEEPLIAMEGAVQKEYPKLSDFIDEIITLANITKKYNGKFVFLWHSNTINVTEWKDYSAQYEQIISSIVC